MTSQTRTRLASGGGDVSDDSALESDASSLAGSDDGRSASSRGRAGTGRRDLARPRPGSRASSPPRRAPKRDRMLLREWLQTQADRRSVPGMHWYDAEHTMIRLPWKHGSRSGWTIGDCQLYRAWALYTGKHRSNVTRRPL